MKVKGIQKKKEKRVPTELYEASILMLLRKKVPQTRGNRKSCD